MYGIHTTGARLQWSKKGMMILIMNTGRLEHDVVFISASQGIYFFPDMQVYH